VKVFVAVSTNKSLRNSAGAVDGELVWVLPFVPPCSACGCQVSAIGLASQRSTHRFKVADRNDITEKDYLELLSESWRRQGVSVSPEARAAATGLAKVQLDAAARLPVGRMFNLRERIDGAIIRDRLSV
jgi:hypothetical protein